MTTIGTKYDYKYFLPRICEIIATEGHLTNIEVLLAGKLLMAEFSDWPDVEKAAVKDFLLELWRSLLCNWPFHLQPDAVLCCVAATGATRDALDMWSRFLETERNAQRHLAEWICWGPGWEGPPGFWDDVADDWNAIEAWVLSLDTACFAERAFAEYSETPDGQYMDNKLQQYLAAIR